MFDTSELKSIYSNLTTEVVEVNVYEERFYVLIIRIMSTTIRIIISNV